MTLCFAEVFTTVTCLFSPTDNFHLYDDGPLRRLQVFSDSNKKISHVPTGGCLQGLTTNPSGSMVHVTPNATAGVKLFVKDSSGNRYYLRVNTQSSNVELVCQSHVDTVSCSTSPILIETII